MSKVGIGVLEKHPHSNMFVLDTLKTPIYTHALKDTFRAGVVSEHPTLCSDATLPYVPNSYIPHTIVVTTQS